MPGEILVGTFDLTEAKRLRGLLEDRGIAALIRTHEEDCTSKNCRPKVELLIQESDVEATREFFASERARSLEGLEATPGFQDEVFDPEKSEARCPACGTSFSTTLRECPDCGLVFMVEEA